jgi:hypothetical protein
MTDRDPSLRVEVQDSLIDTHLQAQESHLLHCAKLAGLPLAPGAVKALAHAAHHCTLMHFDRSQPYFGHHRLLHLRDQVIFRHTSADDIHAAAVASGLSIQRVYQVLNRERRAIKGRKP